jgi:hypothetical protein
LRGAARTGFLAGARLAAVFLAAFLRGFAVFRRRGAGFRAGAFLRFTLALVFLLDFAFFLAAILTSRRLPHVIERACGHHVSPRSVRHQIGLRHGDRRHPARHQLLRRGAPAVHEIIATGSSRSRGLENSKTGLKNPLEQGEH